MPVKRLPPRTLGEYKERIWDLCALHECSTTSGVRTWKRYSAICARAGKTPSANSKHLLANGAWADDLVPDDNTAERRLALVADAHTLGLWGLDEGDHVHLQGKPPGAV